MERRPRQAEGQAWHSRPPHGPGPESPPKHSYTPTEEGARRPTRPEPQPEGLSASWAREPPASGQKLKGALDVWLLRMGRDWPWLWAAGAAAAVWFIYIYVA